MAQRRFGPTTGAGVAVVEMDADKILEPAPLGVCAYLGILKRGDTNKLISTYSKRSTLKRVGGIIPESLVGDAAIDFWDHSGGAGELHFIRVTDGTEVAASITLYSRETPRQPVLKVAAKNGGKWGGKRKLYLGYITGSSDLTATTVTTGKTMKLNEWAGATLSFKGIASKTYEVVSNTTAGVITVKSDSNVKLDYGAAVDRNYVIEMARDKASEVTVEVADGEADPSTLFSMAVYVDGLFVRKYPNLSMDPTSRYYVVRVVNDDDSNDEIAVTDLNTPNSTPAARRPGNDTGAVGAVSALSMTAVIGTLRVTNSPTNANPALAMGTTTDTMWARDRLTITMTSATTFTVKSEDLMGGVTLAASGTLGTLYTPIHPNLPPFTITNGSTVLASGDTMEIAYTPLEPNALVGGLLYPDKINAPMAAYRIVSNDHKIITVGSGDMTSVSTGGDIFTVQWPQPLINGYDGLAGVADVDYTKHLDPNTSKFNGLIGQNKGLVKLATPGKTATAVQKAGLQMAEARNWQYRVEIPDTTTSEDAAITYINSTIGRNDFGVTAFPSYADVDNSERSGTKKRISLTGAIHGREAAVAKTFDGYHKAAAGVDVTFPRILALPTGDTVLNEEVLNPQGLNVIKKNKGNYILWGDRSIALDPAWRFKHQRELMSHYENRLREGFDWLVFAINDPATAQQASTTLRAFFKPEWAKGAIRGGSFDESCSIKVGDDINTNETRATGDMYAEIKLRLADTVERLIMRVGKAGIFESLSA